MRFLANFMKPFLFLTQGLICANMQRPALTGKITTLEAQHGKKN